MRTFVGILAGLTVFAFVAPATRAETGTGAYSPARGDILAAARVRPLSELSDDMIRFSSTPALGGRAWIFELQAAGTRGARGEARFFRGHPRDRWRQTGRVRLTASAADYARLTAAVDALLARGELKKGADDIVVCTDGPGYVTERRRGATSQWLDGFCGASPNNEIAALAEDAITEFGRPRGPKP